MYGGAQYNASYINRDLDLIRRDHERIKKDVRDIKSTLYDVCRHSGVADSSCNKIIKSGIDAPYTLDNGAARRHRTAQPTDSSTNVLITTAATTATTNPNANLRTGGRSDDAVADINCGTNIGAYRNMEPRNK